MSVRRNTPWARVIDKRNIRSLLKVVRGGVVLGSGQAIARLCGLALAAYLARKLSIREFGELILAQTLARYINVGSDMGSKLVGARLISKFPDGTGQIISDLQRKRIALGIVSVGLAVLYAAKGPTLPFAREFLVLFSLSVLPYALTVDWVAWGMKRFRPMSAWQAGTALLLLGLTVLFLEVFKSYPLGWIAAANGLAMLGGAAFLWVWWVRSRRRTPVPATSDEMKGMLRREARWGVVLLLGLAAAFNVVFQCVDVLLLSGLSTAEQVAQYGAAYKIINVILSSYWLFTTAAYPYLANVQWSRQSRRLLAITLVGLAAGGLAIAVVLRYFAHPVTVLVFGLKYKESASLLSVLAFALPLDFMAAFCATTLVSAGENIAVTVGIVIALAVNLVLNLTWIPKFAAVGAAWATIASYGVLAVAYLVMIGPAQKGARVLSNVSA